MTSGVFWRFWRPKSSEASEGIVQWNQYSSSSFDEPKNKRNITAKQADESGETKNKQRHGYVQPAMIREMRGRQVTKSPSMLRRSRRCGCSGCLPRLLDGANGPRSRTSCKNISVARNSEHRTVTATFDKSLKQWNMSWECRIPFFSSTVHCSLNSINSFFKFLIYGVQKQDS